MTFVEWMDVEVHEMNSDSMEIRIPYRDEYSNELGATHGGVIMSVVDTVTGLLAIDMKYLAPTISSYTNFLNPIVDTEYIYASANIVKRGRTIITIDGKVWTDDGTIVAVNRSECTVVRELEDDEKSVFVKSLIAGTYKKY